MKAARSGLYAWGIMLLAVVCSTGYRASAQPLYYECGTKAIIANYPPVVAVPSETQVVKIFVHDIADGGYGGRLRLDTIADRLQVAAQFFLPHKICFMISGYRAYPTNNNNLSGLDLENAAEVNAVQSLAINGQVNLFLHSEIRQGQVDMNSPRYPAAYTFSVPGNIIAVSDLRIATALAHQLAHALGLYHTSESSFGQENVARSGGCSNCSTAGDLLCGTAAERSYPDSIVNASCIVTGSTYQDACNNTVTKSPDNLMSMSKETCRDLLVTGQGVRAIGFLLTNATLSSTIAADNLVITTNQVFSSGSPVFAATASVTIQAPSFTVNASAKAGFSAQEIVIKPGTTFSPSADGLVHCMINTVVCN